jgi:uncharacterized protein YggT (Ycf19 family)
MVHDILVAIIAALAPYVVAGAVSCTAIRSFQGMRINTGEPFDHSIHGCQVISLLYISAYFNGVRREDNSTLEYIIFVLCHPVLAALRAHLPSIEYTFISVAVASAALASLAFFDVRPRIC